jgi:hypothetical protein
MKNGKEEAKLSKIQDIWYAIPQYSSTPLLQYSTAPVLQYSSSIIIPLLQLFKEVL